MYKDNSITNLERIGRVSGLKYLLKSPDMIKPSEFSIFMKNEENKTTLLNLIEQVYVNDNTKLKDRVIYFSKETNCRNISADGTQYCDTFFSDNEEADAKLVALVKGYERVNNEKLLVQSPSGDIDIIVLFLLHCFGTNIFLDTGHGDARKIIDISCPMLLKIEFQGLSGILAFSGNDYIPSFSPERQKEILENIIEVAGIS